MKTIIKFTFLFLISLFLTIANVKAYSKKIIVPVSDCWKELFNSKNATYIIRKEFDLKGNILVIPDNSCIKFEGGKIKNGRIHGNCTSIMADEICIFEKISLSGTWENKIVYGRWLDFVEDQRVDNASNFINLMTLCRSDIMTHLYMPQGVFFCSVKKESSNIKVPSNVYWHNLSTLCQLPSNNSKYGFVELYKSDNVTIDGGLFVGDVNNHLGKNGEWGHGIKLAGATNVTLKNLVVREFWGDGIDLIEADYVDSIKAGVGNCKGITIKNVKCLYNRRQGMSIEAAENVIVEDSEFAYTGKLAFTPPGAGVDIEPWCNNGEKIKNIKFNNCFFHNNVGGSDFCCLSNSMYRSSDVAPNLTPKNAISVNACKIGKLYIECTNYLLIKNCEIDKIVHCSKSANVVFSKNRIKKRLQEESYKGAIFIE